MVPHNGILENIRTRRSVREYIDKDVCEEDIKTIIDAGVHAPSGFNSQPWFFVVIKNRGMMQRMSDHCRPLLLKELAETTDEVAIDFRNRLEKEDFNIFYNAPVLVIVLGSNEGFTPDYDCSLCAQNMMLAAHSLGIGSCWIGTACLIQDNQEFMEELGITPNYRVIAPIVLGYAAQEPEEPEKKEPEVVWVR